MGSTAPSTSAMAASGAGSGSSTSTPQPFASRASLMTVLRPSAVAWTDLARVAGAVVVASARPTPSTSTTALVLFMGAATVWVASALSAFSLPPNNARKQPPATASLSRRTLAAGLTTALELLALTFSRAPAANLILLEVATHALLTLAFAPPPRKPSPSAKRRRSLGFATTLLALVLSFSSLALSRAAFSLWLVAALSRAAWRGLFASESDAPLALALALDDHDDEVARGKRSYSLLGATASSCGAWGLTEPAVALLSGAALLTLASAFGHPVLASTPNEASSSNPKTTLLALCLCFLVAPALLRPSPADISKESKRLSMSPSSSPPMLLRAVWWDAASVARRASLCVALVILAPICFSPVSAVAATATATATEADGTPPANDAITNTLTSTPRLATTLLIAALDLLASAVLPSSTKSDNLILPLSGAGAGTSASRRSVSGDSTLPSLATFADASSRLLKRARALFHDVTTASADSKRIFYFLCLTFAFMFVEVVMGLYTGSLGLISDAGHMFFDSTALFIGLFASYASTAWRPDAAYSYGYGRFETIAGFVNAIFLMFVSVFVLTESLERLVEPPELRTEGLLATSEAGLGVNIVGLVFFHEHHHGHSHAGEGGGGHSHAHGGSHSHSHAHAHSHGDAHCDHDNDDDHHDHDDAENGHAHARSLSAATSTTATENDAPQNDNMRGVYLHVLADALGSVGVITSSLLIQYRGWWIADPVCSFFISVLIFTSVLPLLRSTSEALLLREPRDASSKRFHAAVATIAAKHARVVRGVSQAHLWRHSKSILVATAHVEFDPASSWSEREAVVAELVAKLKRDVGATDVTVQAST